jgi:hypothetical protein
MGVGRNLRKSMVASTAHICQPVVLKAMRIATGMHGDPPQHVREREHLLGGVSAVTKSQNAEEVRILVYRQHATVALSPALGRVIKSEGANLTEIWI